MAYAYVGTYSRNGSEGIYRIDVADGEVKIIGSWPGRDPSFLATDGKILAAVYESSKDSAVALYGVNGDGSLTKRSEQPAGGGAPCYAAFDKYNVYTANYLSGEVGMYPLLNDGTLGEGQWIAHFGSGVNKARQEASHAHCALPIDFPSGKPYLTVCDLGTDKVWFYPRMNGRLSLPGYAKDVPPGTGPRHMVCIDDDTWAVNGEMSCEVLIYKGYAEHAELVQRIPFARNTGDGGNTSSALKLSPDGRTLLSAIRGENTLGISRKVNGKFQPAEIVDAHGDWPRDVTFTPDGRYVLAAMERSNEITLFKLTDGGLEYVSKLDIPAPTCICFPG